MLKIISDSADESSPFIKSVERAKLLLPLEKMLEQLGDWELCVEDRLCPFHDDNSPRVSTSTGSATPGAALAIRSITLNSNSA